MKNNYINTLKSFVVSCKKNFIIKLILISIIAYSIIYMVVIIDPMRTDRLRTTITLNFVESILGNTDRSNDNLLKEALSNEIKHIKIKSEEISIKTVGYKKIINIDNVVLLKLDFNTFEEYKDQIRVICKLAVSNSIKINENPSTLLVMNLNEYLSGVKSKLVVYSVVYDEVTAEVKIHGSYEDCVISLK